MALSAPHIPSSEFSQSVLSGATYSKVNGFEVIMMSTYTLGRWGKIFQFLEAETQKTQMLFPEDINRAKGEAYKMKNSTLPLIVTAP